MNVDEKGYIPKIQRQKNHNRSKQSNDVTCNTCNSKTAYSLLIWRYQKQQHVYDHMKVMECRKVNSKSEKQLMNMFFVEAFLSSIHTHFPHIFCEFINFRIYSNARRDFLLEFGTQICQVILNSNVKHRNCTAPNRIALNRTMLSQTIACIIKSSGESFALLRYYAVVSGN